MGCISQDAWRQSALVQYCEFSDGGFGDVINCSNDHAEDNQKRSCTIWRLAGRCWWAMSLMCITLACDAYSTIPKLWILRQAHFAIFAATCLACYTWHVWIFQILLVLSTCLLLVVFCFLLTMCSSRLQELWSRSLGLKIYSQSCRWFSSHRHWVQLWL